LVSRSRVALDQKFEDSNPSSPASNMASPAGLRSNQESRCPAVGAPQHDHCHKGYNEQHDSQQVKQDVVACGPEVDAANTEEAAYDPNHPPGETAHSPLSSNPSRFALIR